MRASFAGVAAAVVAEVAVEIVAVVVCLCVCLCVRGGGSEREASVPGSGAYAIHACNMPPKGRISRGLTAAFSCNPCALAELIDECDADPVYQTHCALTCQFCTTTTTATDAAVECEIKNEQVRCRTARPCACKA